MAPDATGDCAGCQSGSQQGKGNAMNTVLEAGVVITSGNSLPAALLAIGTFAAAGIYGAMKGKAKYRAANRPPLTQPQQQQPAVDPVANFVAPTEDQKRAARIQAQHKQQMPGETAAEFNRRIRS